MAVRLDRKRRRLLAAGGAVGVSAAVGAVVWRQRGATRTPAAIEDSAFPHRLRLPAGEGLYGIYDAAGSFTLVAKPVRHAVLEGRPTILLAYEIEQEGRVYLNPVLRVRRGTALRVRYWNALDEASIVHWHGLKLDTNNDGHPHYAVDAGATYDYQFTVENRAGTYWYHPHPHRLAARQAYRGLAGFFIVDDAEDLALRNALGLALGTTDIPLMIQDKRIADDGALLYAPEEHERMHGHYGDRLLVNLAPAPHLDVETRIYRLRLLNASNARIYRLAFLHGERALDFAVIGGDGGLLARPVAARELFLAPAERADVLLDLSSASTGDRVILASLPFDFMQGSRSPTALPCVPLGLVLFRIVRPVSYAAAIPRTLSTLEPVEEASGPTRRFTLDFRAGVWRINGASYRMTETAFAVKRDTCEIWEFSSTGTPMPHPIHVHGYQFRTLERRSAASHRRSAYAHRNGLAPTELGWKDTVLLWPGETIRLAMDFSHAHTGDQVYMLQCHNLEHESHGMMVNFRVSA